MDATIFVRYEPLLRELPSCLLKSFSKIVYWICHIIEDAIEEVLEPN